jgi:chemotaxis protein MotB
MGKKQPKKGSPAYMTTFADLMSLLLTFFVLLLSMSEIDATRFRKISGSLKMAFGVQRVNVFDEPPKGSSFIQQEYRAGSGRSPMSLSSGANINDPQLEGLKNIMEKNEKIAMLEKQKKLDANFKKAFQRFEEEIKSGKMEIDKKGNELIMRIAENVAFPEQHSALNKSFESMVIKLSELASDVEGEVVVSGHSDDKKLKTTKYKSNWEFSAARANNLAQAMMSQGGVDPDRITVQFHGPTKPLVRNNSDINRRKNRRIEVIIKH